MADDELPEGYGDTPKAEVEAEPASAPKPAKKKAPAKKAAPTE